MGVGLSCHLNKNVSSQLEFQPNLEFHESNFTLISRVIYHGTQKTPFLILITSCSQNPRSFALGFDYLKFAKVDNGREHLL
jgi:hypothetical protein